MVPIVHDSAAEHNSRQAVCKTTDMHVEASIFVETAEFRALSSPAFHHTVTKDPLALAVISRVVP